MEFVKFMMILFFEPVALSAIAFVLLYIRKSRQEKAREAGLQRFQQRFSTIIHN